MRRLAVVIVIGLAAAGRGEAQAVRGQLVDSITRAPLAGAFLTLIDAHGVEWARAITDGAGQFLLAAPAGTYQLRSKRIGFRPYLSPALTLSPGATTSYNAAIDPIPIELAKVVVAGERQCDVTAGASVAALWQEVREALAAVAWTTRAPQYWYEFSHFERDLLTSHRRPVRDSTWSETGFQRVSFVSAPADTLAEHGYVRVDAEGWTYHAPDADVLLSDPFLRTHCFETKAGRGETEGLVGLAFTPARGRALPDISGTLWVNRESAELHHLEFSYTRLPERLIEPRAGGRVDFMRVPSGAWIVREWIIRMPRARIVTEPVSQEQRYQVTGFRETGGSTREIKTAAGGIVYQAQTGTVEVAAAPPAPPAPPAAPVRVQAPPTAPPPPPPPARNSDVLLEDEFKSTTAADAYALVQHYRPNWLHSRGPLSLRDRRAGILKVFIDGIEAGDVDRLRQIRVIEIRELRYLSGVDATTRYGLGVGAGVIEVFTH